MSAPPPYPPITSQPGYYPLVPPAAGGAYPPPQQGGYYPPPPPQPGGGYPPLAAGYPQPGGYQVPQQQPMVPDNCPPGLEYLTEIDQIIVKQKVELLEAFLGCETKNKYKIKNSMGQDIYKAKEETDCCTRNLCGPIRPFEMTIKGYNDQEVMHLYRPLNCQSCLFPCCLQRIEVSAPPGKIIGTVEQEW